MELGRAAWIVVPLAAFAAMLAGLELWRRGSTRWHARRLELAWRRLALPLGLRVVREDLWPSIRGEVAGREFAVDHANFITYGLDAQLGMRVRVDDRPACGLVVTQEEERRYAAVRWHGLARSGEVRTSGDPEFDAVFRMRADEAGVAYLARLGPRARRALLEHPSFEVHLVGVVLWIDFGTYEVTTEIIEAARTVLEELLGAPATEAAALR